MLRTFVCLLAIALAAVPAGARAESEFRTGSASPLTATANLDFVIVVPKVLYLRVGAGNNMASLGTINMISFTVPAASVGISTPIAATAGSGDLGNGIVTARVLGNNGSITLSATTAGPLTTPLGDTLSYGQITTAATTLTSVTPLPAPVLASGATTNTTVPAVANVVSRDARWTYSYANAALVAPGTYGGVNINNGRVVYTASMP